MRVAVFTDNDFDKVNGVTTTLTALVGHAPPDVQPRIYTAAALGTDDPTYLALRSFPVPIPFYSEMSMYIPRFRQYLERVLDDHVDVLHLTTPGPMGLAALWVAKKTGLPLVGSFHTDLATYTSLLSGSTRLGHWMGEYMRWMYGRCQQTLVPSSATRELLVAAGSRASRISLWTRGVDTQLFSPARRSSQLRSAWHVSERCPALLYVGRVSREKGLEMVPELLYRLRALGVAHRLIVAGDGPLRPWLQQQCPEAVFTGSLGRAAVAEVFASADAFVFPSQTDTAGNVVLEAQASGVPVIVSNRGGPRENMVDGVTGAVCAGSDARHWAAVTSDVLHDAVARASMAQAARDYALTRRWDIALSPVYQAYRDAARRPTTHRPSIDHAA
ncbi:MAG TPA: glycosyltransferase family 1 protein [Vicinamibacterales bacterium]|nr:glycosyltransferase family 1 protein [Vicinamibacterales bacterium]